jgi:hypothetical protein
MLIMKSWIDLVTHIYRQLAHVYGQGDVAPIQFRAEP